jgi:hypothetical protein
MRRGLTIVLVWAGCLIAAPWFAAQTPANPAGQGAPADGDKKTVPAQSQPEANPFPGDTSNVPVMPAKNVPISPEGSYGRFEPGTEAGNIPLAGDDVDPVRSPDEAPAEPAGSADQGSSSSLANIENALPGPDDDQPAKGRRKMPVVEPTHKETASKDLDVGKYYMDTKDWKAALSRFQSAMVLDPENPEVYWGLAESERHLGDFADARTYYEKVAEYDPESRHGKDSIKALKDPQIANAQKASVAKPPSDAPK